MNPVIDRLIEERRKWRQDTPNGFSANPSKNIDGTINLLKWECKVPGPRRTPLEGKTYAFTIEFDEKCLNKRLKIICNSKIDLPYVYSSGQICSSLLSFWPKCGLKQIMFGLQSFLELKYLNSTENRLTARMFRENSKQYNERVQNINDDIQVICID